MFLEQTKHLPQFWTILETVRVIGITMLRDLETGAAFFDKIRLVGTAREYRSPSLREG